MYVRPHRLSNAGDSPLSSQLSGVRHRMVAVVRCAAPACKCVRPQSLLQNAAAELMWRPQRDTVGICKTVRRTTAGATGVVMYNHIPLESSRVITSDTTHGAAMLSAADGAKVLAALAAGEATMTFYNDSAVRFSCR